MQIDYRRPQERGVTQLMYVGDPLFGSGASGPTIAVALAVAALLAFAFAPRR